MPARAPKTTPAPSGLGIRKAVPHDLAELVRIEQAAFAGDRLSRRSLAALVLSPAAEMLVAATPSSLAGYAIVLLRRGSRLARLYSLAVAPDATGGGVGALLLRSAEAAAAARGAVRMRLEVRADNSAAIRLYERHFYAPEGRRDDYYQDGAAALRYARDLCGEPSGGAVQAPCGQAA